MKYLLRTSVFVCILGLLTLMAPQGAQAQTEGMVSVTCDSGGSFDNGVEFVVNLMRPGFSYTATAIGLNGFDPVLAVLDEDGTGLCNDDNGDAAGFSVDLPTTGRVSGTRTSAQVVFSQNAGQMADVSLVVGGFGNQSGEFVLVLEGMAATDADGAGDPFSVRLSEPLVTSGIPLTTYMIGVVDVLDPRMFLSGSDLTPVADDNGDLIDCDDAGSSRCWGDSESLQGSRVSRTLGRSSNADTLDASISLDLDIFSTLDFSDELYLTYVMSRIGSNGGDYVIAFHTGTSDGGGEVAQAPTPTTAPPANDPKDPTDEPDSTAGLGAGIEVTCENGAEFTNGVEFVVNQMRPGFTYTATAIGLNGFDPVLAVLDRDGGGLCNDDSADAGRYSVNLPTVGRQSADRFSAQVTFNQTAGQMADVSLVVGGFGNASGEFILILEGMAATDADGAGDPFSVRLTPALVNSEVPVSVYMMGLFNDLDPLVYLAGADGAPFNDENGAQVSCDDAGGENLCWSDTDPLSSSSIDGARDTRGDNLDAQLTVPLDEFRELDFADGPFYLTFVMTSYNQSSFGEYVIAFHAEAR